VCSDMTKYTLKADQESITCSAAFCTDGECCIGQCSGYICPVDTQAIVPVPPTCPGLECRTSDCCLNRCPKNFPCGNNQHQNPDLPACAGSVCLPKECCVSNPTCPATYPCPPMWKLKSTSPVCVGSTCQDSDCCEPKTCSSYPNINCGNGTLLPGSTQCGLCNAQDCCSSPKTCASYTATCPVGSVPLNHPSETECPPSGCTSLLCCCTKCNTCGRWADALTQNGQTVCPIGSNNIRSNDCGASQCTTSFCCAQSVCDKRLCAAGQGLDSDAGSTNCFHPENTACPHGCTRDDCCV